MDQIIIDVIPELIATLVGIFIGSMAAFAVDRRAVAHARRKRKHLTLRNLLDELEENFTALKAVEPAYRATSYGKSVYISTIHTWRKGQDRRAPVRQGLARCHPPSGRRHVRAR